MRVPETPPGLAPKAFWTPVIVRVGTAARFHYVGQHISPALSYERDSKLFVVRPDHPAVSDFVVTVDGKSKYLRNPECGAETEPSPIGC